VLYGCDYTDIACVNEACLGELQEYANACSGGNNGANNGANNGQLGGCEEFVN
jgi:hypothetical protein